MSLEKDLRDFLMPLLPSGSNVWPDGTQPGAQAPLIVYQQIGGEEYWYVDNTKPSNENARVQIGSWAKSRPEASALARAVSTRLCTDNPPFNVRPIGAPTSDFDEDLGLYGSIQDFSIWYTAVPSAPVAPMIYANDTGDQYVDDNGDTYTGN